MPAANVTGSKGEDELETDVSHCPLASGLTFYAQPIDYDTIDRSLGTSSDTMSAHLPLFVETSTAQPLQKKVVGISGYHDGISL